MKLEIFSEVFFYYYLVKMLIYNIDELVIVGEFVENKVMFGVIGIVKSWFIF